MRFRMNHVTVHAAILALSAACVPYTVATTAQPVKPGESERSLIVMAMPPVSVYESTSGRLITADYERRRGIDSVSDWGLRFPSFTGIVGSYKRLLTRTDSPVLTSFIGGAGFINMGNHAHFEETLIISKNDQPQRAPSGVVRPHPSNALLPYGGLRAMQFIPMNSESVHDKPTVGGFAGLRFRDEGTVVSVEVGVFHDPSALAVRKNNWVIVPAVALHGTQMMSRIPRPRFPVPSRRGW